MLRLLVTTLPVPAPLAGWPDWAVVAAATLLLAAALWILGRILRLALWLLLIAVLAGGAAWVVLLLLK